MNRILLARTISGLLPFIFVFTPAQAASLASHRAFYVLEVGRLDSGAGISSISGKLAYEITGSDCDGYAVSYRIANRVLQGDGAAAQVTDSQQSSFESGDGLELDLQQKQFTNARLDSQSRIKVKKPKAGELGEGEIIAAKTTPFKTDAKAVFPTDFQKLLASTGFGNRPTRVGSRQHQATWVAFKNWLCKRLC